MADKTPRAPRRAWARMAIDDQIELARKLLRDPPEEREESDEELEAIIASCEDERDFYAKEGWYFGSP